MLHNSPISRAETRVALTRHFVLEEPGCCAANPHDFLQLHVFPTALLGEFSHAEAIQGADVQLA